MWKAFPCTYEITLINLTLTQPWASATGANADGAKRISINDIIMQATNFQMKGYNDKWHLHLHFITVFSTDTNLAIPEHQQKYCAVRD